MIVKLHIDSPLVSSVDWLRGSCDILTRGPLLCLKAFWLNFQMPTLVEIISAVQSGSRDRWLLIIHQGREFGGVKDRPTFRAKELFWWS